MRQWRPELFSDSQNADAVVLGRSEFEFHLNEITSNRKEIEFEDFCRRLCEKEICPNLFVLGGPTGGGDGGVDSATYPVSPELAALRFWGGVARPPSDNWAFAFSAKEDWVAKVKSDVAKVAALPRRFQKVFFVTNRAAAPKRKSETEAALTKLHRLEVTILDRAWIVEKVFSNRHEEMAVASLHLDRVKETKHSLGPRDTARRRRLDELLAALRDPAAYRGNTFALATDYLEAAQLSAGLECHRSEIDGHFQQACALALKIGHIPLIVRTHYSRAWKLFWWFDDTEAVLQAYGIIEGLLDRIDDAEIVELLLNLHNLLRAEFYHGRITAAVAKIPERIKSLRKRLNELAQNTRRPNNAIYSKILLHFNDLWPSRNDAERMKSTFAGMESSLKKAKGYPTVPVMSFCENLTEMGQFHCDLPGYDSLFRAIQAITRERKGETEEGMQQYEYGIQLVEKNKLREGLRELGLARLKLAKEETLDESVDAAFACGTIFRDLGFKWAARMDVLSACHVALYSKEKINSSPLRATYISLQMIWRELELGRIAPFLAWVRNTALLLKNAESTGADTKKFREECFRIDQIFGCFLLNLPLDEVQELAALEKTMTLFGMHASALCLAYRQNNTAEIREYLPKIADNKPELNKLFEWWKSQPAAEQLPKELCGETRTVCKFSTTVMGISYTIRCRNKIGPILFAENLLGIIENLFSLAKWENFAFVTDRVDIFIDEDTDGKSPPDLKFEHFAHGKEQRLVFAPQMEGWLRSQHREAATFLERLLLDMIFASTIDPMEDLAKELNDMHREATFDRALGFSPTATAVLDLIAPEHYDINHWINTAVA